MKNLFWKSKKVEKKSWKVASPYFSPSEILSPETLKYPHLVDYESLVKLNNVRRRWGRPLYINQFGHNLRGVRSSKEIIKLYNEIGAALHSMHGLGKAFDVSPEFATKEELEKLEAIAIEEGFTFTKIYPTWVHIDNRTLWELG